MGIYTSLKSEFKEFNIQCKIKLCLEKKDQMQINFKRSTTRVSGSSGVCVPDRQVLVAGDGPQPGRPAHRQARQEHDRPTGCHTMSFVTFVSMVCQACVKMLLCA